ncbi:hypothetical protein HG536_0H03050 [Torulaspora globosa]|uniref:Uncharacterized protein n=1 Tax=Torulaspora globosa TaxID=48254 RepID=A0A7G3ZN44_9SACH|nr:uncharacterized protein HG536_0H03050 [Torulaspora globosa]QLL34930.1 hypothetical protein HG536_0H03050 [Torulaspora globosa]
MSKQSPRISSSGAESVNKWKIPHYYRRSSAASSLQSNGSDSANGSTPSTPGVNIMSSPKKVLMEDPKKGTKRPVYRSRKSKKKNGEMVFVNYTVQDSASEDSVTSVHTPELPTAGASPVLNSKKKSSRSRMLKIFGSSKAPPAVIGGSNLVSCAENEVMSDPYAVSTTSAPAKRSYGSFLKYGKFHGSSAHNRGNEPVPGLLSEEVVPKSVYSPNLVKPAPIGRFVGDSPRKVGYLGGGNPNVESVESPMEYRYLGTNHASSAAELGAYPYSKASFSESVIGAKKHADENDASIAFSKMFSRKRANTGGSESSLLSLSHNAQEQLQSTMVPALRKNMSASSISSISYRSPIRTASPARPRSGTRGSYTHAVSSHSRADSQDAGSFIGAESFLDSQMANRSGSAAKHRRKQESISESHRLYNSSATNSTVVNSSGNQSVVTPSSSSLVTPPPFTSGYSVPSNTSASSTPSAMDLTLASQTGSFGNLVNSISSINPAGNHSTLNVSQPVLDRDSSSELLFEESDIPTPVDNLPALRSMTKALETKVEDSIGQIVPSQGAHRGFNTNDRETKRSHQNIDVLDAFLPHEGSTSSSQGGSILTKSTSSVSDNIVIGHWQDQGCYSLIDAGPGGAGIREKTIPASAFNLSGGTTAVESLEYEAFESQIFLGHNYQQDEQSHQVDMEFDFVNSGNFLNKQKEISPGGSNSSGQVEAVEGTSANGQNSAVTSIANFSPGTNATVSVEEVGNSGVYHRNFDRLGAHANSLSHAGPKAGQPLPLYSMGQWKAINSDLEAITDSLGIGGEMNDTPYMYQPNRG